MEYFSFLVGDEKMSIFNIATVHRLNENQLNETSLSRVNWKCIYESALLYAGFAIQNAH